MKIRRHCRGFSLVSAVFLLVVLAGLGAVATRLTAFQQQGTNQMLLSTQAMHAAKTGGGLGRLSRAGRYLRTNDAKSSRRRGSAGFASTSIASKPTMWKASLTYKYSSSMSSQKPAATAALTMCPAASKSR